MPFFRRTVQEDEITPLVQKIMKEYLNPPVPSPPNGYNPLEAIRRGLFHWIAVPFNGKDIYCQLRCPNQTQLENCGDISNITIKAERTEKKHEYSYEDIIKLRNYQENLCKIVLNIPTYDTIASLVGKADFVLSDKRKELDNITAYFHAHIEEMTETEKNVITTQIKTMELQIGYILPTDTMDFLTKWAMGNDISEIKQLTRENLLRAASLAKAYNKAPTDYLSGVFTDHNKSDIDTYAFGLLNEFIKDRETVKESHNWYLRKRKPGGA